MSAIPAGYQEAGGCPAYELDFALMKLPQTAV